MSVKYKLVQRPDFSKGAAKDAKKYFAQMLSNGNVSFDDLGGTISPSQNPDALLEHNTFYLRDGVPFVRARRDGGSYTEKDDTILPLP